MKLHYKERKHHGANTVACLSITSNGCREISASYKSITRIMKYNLIDLKLQIKFFPVIDDLGTPEVNCASVVCFMSETRNTYACFMIYRLLHSWLRYIIKVMLINLPRNHNAVSYRVFEVSRRNSNDERKLCGKMEGLICNMEKRS